MARRRQFGFYPASTADYSRGNEPELARRLGRLGRALHLRLIGISGYRTPAHSVEVGGFADDPHTRGEASDTPGVEGVPEATLRRYGLTRPFPGAREADHIQLLSGGTRAPGRAPRGYTLADLWTQAGGRRGLGPIMAAIAMAESGAKVDAVGGPNSNGTYDYGLWQINSSHASYDKARLLSDPLYNARAAVAIERSQGLGAWSTYSTGAYKSFMGSARATIPGAARTRPGGGTDGDSSGVDDAFAAYTGEYDTPSGAQDVGFFRWLITPPWKQGNLPGIPDAPNPLDLFRDTGKAVHDVNDFMKWVAWLFHPKNVLRAVEFVTGLTLIGMGIHSLIEVWRDAPDQAATKRTGRAARELFDISPPGRALKVRKVTQHAKTHERRAQREKRVRDAAQRGKTKEQGRVGRKRMERDIRKMKRGEEEIPF